jgi:hypothetical protein
MVSEIALENWVPKLRLDLQDFVSLVRTFFEAATGANEREGARSAIKAMINEVRKTYETVVSELLPLYSALTAKQFDAEFQKVFASFKKLYLNRNDVVRTHCKIVREELDKLEHRLKWMSSVPLAQKTFTRIKNRCEEWFVVDVNLVAEMEMFFQSTNQFMESIADLERQSKSAQAFKVMKDGLKKIEPDLIGLRTLLGELDSIGRGL